MLNLTFRLASKYFIDMLASIPLPNDNHFSNMNRYAVVCGYLRNSSSLLMIGTRL